MKSALHEECIYEERSSRALSRSVLIVRSAFMKSALFESVFMKSALHEERFHEVRST